MHKLFYLILIAAFTNISCSSGGGGGGNGGPTYVCNTVDYPGGVTISGNAVYEYRANGGGAIASPSAIRFAEVKVFDANNNLIQCSATNSTGAFSVVIPQSSGTHTIAVNSIIYNDTTKAFVYNNPSNNQIHGISMTFTAETTKSVGTLTATASSSSALKGGAFNILDKIHSANEFLVTKTAGCTTLFSNCPVFTGAPLVKVYWDKGVNPGTYFSAGAISFYIPGERELYILGGDAGDVNSSDCDHFDNSIILHEYGHFIEDVFSKTNSPGGSHSGDSIIDARLAWGEGWGNFFQAAVLENPVYRDTSGNITGSYTTFFNENLENAGLDNPSTMGEGNFREFSITRLLWDAIDTPNDSGADTVTSPFSELWTVFAGTTGGLASSSYNFRNVGLFHTLQQALSGATNWSSIRTLEKHRGSEQDYARGVTLGGSCPSGTVIQAANISGGQPENGSVSNSNHFASNDFYSYYHSGGSFNFTLNYTTDNTASADLDIFIYPAAYKFGGTSSKSATTNVSNGTTNASESVTGSLAAGLYMINIRVDTGVRLGGSSTYQMTLGGQSLCPN